MDNFKAKQLENSLIGKEFNGYKIIELLNNGKSAAVFLGQDSKNTSVAVKIFDNDLISRYGSDIQEKRIEQEISLKNHTVANLIPILDGGKTRLDGEDYFFIIMTYVDGQNIKDYIQSQEYDIKLIKKVCYALFSVTEELLKMSIVHRDIKPENIMINKEGDVVLMDLGVMKFIGVPSFSDLDEKQFVGTLRYAAPEFLSRTEQDDVTGWKAVNLYQIGAVLHDLIMKKVLFEDISPYSNLVIAIKEDAPAIQSDKYAFETMQLVRDLMTKDVNTRLNLVTDDRIINWAQSVDDNIGDIEIELDEIFKVTSVHKLKSQVIESISRSNQEKKVRRDKIGDELFTTIIACFEKLKQKRLFRTYQYSDSFRFDTDNSLLVANSLRNVIFKISGGLQDGFSRPLYILIRLVNDEKSIGAVCQMGLFLESSINVDFLNPKDIFRQLANAENPRSLLNTYPNPNSSVSASFSLHEIFQGTLGLDQQFSDFITLKILKMIKKALSLIKSEVESELDWKEQLVNGINGTRIMNSQKTIKITNLD